jgi:hypothetical protein
MERAWSVREVPVESEAKERMYVCMTVQQSSLVREGASPASFFQDLLGM